MHSYTRDITLFNYDYKMDLLKTAIERDRIFVTKRVRQDTEESDEEGYFDKAPEEDEANEIEDTPAAADTSKK